MAGSGEESRAVAGAGARVGADVAFFGLLLGCVPTAGLDFGGAATFGLDEAAVFVFLGGRSTWDAAPDGWTGVVAIERREERRGAWFPAL